MKTEKKISNRAKTYAETNRGSKNSGAKRRKYGISDIIEKVIELKGYSIEREWNSTKSFVEECCKSLGHLWGLVPLVEFIESEIFFNRVVEIIVKVSSGNDPKIKRIINKINNEKEIKKEESESLNKFIEDLLKKGKPKEEQEKIKNEYNKKRETLDKIIEMKEEMKNNFCKSYDRYIDEMLKLEFKIKGFNTEKHLKEILNTNEEILEVIDKKINKIIYENEVRRVTCEAFENKENGKKIGINELAEKIRRTGELYGVDSRKDINELEYFEII